jgi:transcriptional regulator with XRE-family HTH domain
LNSDAATPLQAARYSLGWKQARVLTVLTAQAKTESIAIATQASLKTMLSRWENGTGQPDPTYQRLFCQIYDREPEELGFQGTTGQLSRMRVAPTVQIETVEYFSAVFDQHVRADQLLGPRHLVDAVRAQAELLDRILPDAQPGPIRDELFRLSCSYNEFAGWLYQDAGDTDNAMLFSDRAMERALALDDPTNSVYLLMRKSNIASDRGRADRALNLATAAAQMMHKVAPRVRALALVQQARAYALRGDAENCVRSLDAAMREVSRADTDPDPLAGYCTPEYVAMESAASWANLGKPAKTIVALERALSTWPTGQRRDLGLCQARLSAAYADEGDVAQATELGRVAVATVGSAISARAVNELSRVRETLTPWRRDSSVSELINMIKGLNRAA